MAKYRCMFDWMSGWEKKNTSYSGDNNNYDKAAWSFYLHNLREHLLQWRFTVFTFSFNIPFHACLRDRRVFLPSFLRRAQQPCSSCLIKIHQGSHTELRRKAQTTKKCSILFFSVHSSWLIFFLSFIEKWEQSGTRTSKYSRNSRRGPHPPVRQTNAWGSFPLPIWALQLWNTSVQEVSKPWVRFYLISTHWNTIRASLYASSSKCWLMVRLVVPSF